MPPGKAARDGIAGAQNSRTRNGLTLDGPLPDLLAFVEEVYAVPVAVMPRLGGDLAGAYFRRDGRCVIVINAEDPPSRMRFTLAHELGHHYFKHLDRVQELKDGISDTRAELRNPDWRDWWEVQANAFAAELLVPQQAVERWNQERGGGAIGLDAVVDLACEFGVSLVMASIRLETAGLLTDPERIARLRREIQAGDADDLVKCHAPYEDGVSKARASAPRLPPALTNTSLAAVASGKRTPAQAAAQMGHDARAFADAMADLDLIPPA